MGDGKKGVKPTRWCEMAKEAVSDRQVSVRLTSLLFAVSETCYRYQPKRSRESAVIADWLIRLTHKQRNWGAGLCSLYLPNVKVFG